MRGITLIGLAAAFATRASAACSSALKIDDFSKWSSNTNALDSWTSDDASMTSISASNGVLSFKPKSESYFYETFACQAASTSGYNSIQFSIKGPAGGSATLEIQTQSSCGASGYTSYYTTFSGLTGNTQTITIPLSQFSGANANAITSFVWSGFSSTTTTWQISNLQFGCSGAGSTSISATKEATSSSTPTTMVTTTAPQPSGTCAPLLIDDWTSQSRLTFLFYNAMLLPTSDDASMTSLVVGTPAKNRVTINPKDTSSYFYSQLGCTDAKKASYGGISLRIKAPTGTTFSVELDSSSSCDAGTPVAVTQTTSELGWAFDGTEKLYTIPFSKFSGLDSSKLVTILFSGFSKSISFGPMAFYCGSTGEYIVTTSDVPAGPSSTVAAPTGTAAALVVDKFADANSNALGFWHGSDEGMTTTYSGGKLTIKSTDSDYSFYTQVSASCTDMSKYKGSYLHIAYSGSTAFSIAVQQHNSKCDDTIAPYPDTWDSIEASRYAKDGNIYVPINHFNIELTRTIGIALKGFYTADPVTISTIEFVPSIPAGTIISNKLESGDLVFACKRPNSFAFAIDDGSPEYAQEVMKIVKEEGIKVTFFTVGAPLLDESTNLTNVYREMQSQGHQVALHSYTHPKMEGLPDYASIDWEYNEDIKAVEKQLNGLHTNYFRPPFGTEGARMRQRLAQTLGAKPTITMWSVDVEDWLWAETDTPEQQLTAFQRDVDKGGNLVVLHYLYPSTVGYLREFIQKAKATGKQLMRVDQCMEDPNAPAL
ncbi:glycoside hydrolase/deacetylase [Massarina eburnea CBS 473.64]|uniref:Glycoside hydrolase/deacetylase n=1 Tax=Massarina eburnea CBS 473.64 TaxID=1395130 RepID=A0A6A6S937_9PLEO|nr:glycoside hydrolase/deacetylase [Massarina eburnea CBS 473.64]